MTTFLQSTRSNDSFASAMAALLLLVRGKMKSGENYWAYIAIKPDMLESFNIAKANGMFELEEYGTILDWGQDDSPPAQIQAQMEAIYGVRNTEEDALVQRMKPLVEYQ